MATLKTKKKVYQVPKSDPNNPAYNNDDLEAVMSSLSSHQNIRLIPVEFLKITKSYTQAALLSQLLYWSGKECAKSRDNWVYKSDAQWMEEMMMGRDQVRRAVSRLKSLGVIDVITQKITNVNCINHYKVQYRVLLAYIHTVRKQEEIERPQPTAEDRAIADILNAKSAAKKAKRAAALEAERLAKSTEEEIQLIPVATQVVEIVLEPVLQPQPVQVVTHVQEIVVPAVRKLLSFEDPNHEDYIDPKIADELFGVSEPVFFAPNPAETLLQEMRKPDSPEVWKPDTLLKTYLTGTEITDKEKIKNIENISNSTQSKVLCQDATAPDHMQNNSKPCEISLFGDQQLGEEYNSTNQSNKTSKGAPKIESQKVIENYHGSKYNSDEYRVEQQRLESFHRDNVGNIVFIAAQRTGIKNLLVAGYNAEQVETCYKFIEPFCYKNGVMFNGFLTVCKTIDCFFRMKKLGYIDENNNFVKQAKKESRYESNSTKFNNIIDQEIERINSKYELTNGRNELGCKIPSSTPNHQAGGERLLQRS